MTTPRSNFVKLRLTDLEKAEWQKAAGGARKLSDWIRSVCNAATLSDEIATEREDALEPAQEEAAAPATSLGGRGERTATRLRTAAAPPPDQCPRWMHHRPGVYCGACKKVVAK